MNDPMSRQRLLISRMLVGGSKARDASSNEAHLQPIDLILSGISSAVAVYAAGASLSSDKNAQFFVWVVLVGTLCSSLTVRLMGKTRLVYADAIAYTFAATIAAFGISSLNQVVPESIYSGMLLMPGVLSWMLALGSFAVWRDQTMLFQAVPAVALFGLVGCYDTFHDSVIYFFVFLICQAVLLARTHGRLMLRQARSSGVEALEMSVMRKGPWRWMAGPEWALGSALTIVLVSVIGAPILRESAKSFSGLVKYTPPVSPLVQASSSVAAAGGVRIGTGPNTLRDNPVLRVTIPEPMYLRASVYGRYEHGAWMHPVHYVNQDSTVPIELGKADIDNPVRFAFRVEPIEIHNSIIPVPGEVLSLAGESNGAFSRNNVGSFYPLVDPPFPPLEGQSIASGKSTTEEADSRIVERQPEYGETDAIPDDVAALAQRVTRGSRTDFHKAMAIQNTIERIAKYNLKAEKTPEGEDPVSYFLFKSKEGYCDLFASAMTLMARSAGLPARYVTGYYPFSDNRDMDGRYMIRQRDAHAWCEILFKGRGWVVFDATEGAVQVDGGELGSANDRSFWQTGWFLILTGFIGGGGALYGFYVAIGRFRRYRASQRSADRDT
ncbi:MAG: transglutaminase family protein, partial [Fimbriimonadales bacterium]